MFYEVSHSLENVSYSTVGYGQYVRYLLCMLIYVYTHLYIFIYVHTNLSLVYVHVFSKTWNKKNRDLLNEGRRVRILV